MNHSPVQEPGFKYLHVSLITQISFYKKSITSFFKYIIFRLFIRMKTAEADSIRINYDGVIYKTVPFRHIHINLLKTAEILSNSRTSHLAPKRVSEQSNYCRKNHLASSYKQLRCTSSNFLHNVPRLLLFTFQYGTRFCHRLTSAVQRKRMNV